MKRHQHFVGPNRTRHPLTFAVACFLTAAFWECALVNIVPQIGEATTAASGNDLQFGLEFSVAIREMAEVNPTARMPLEALTTKNGHYIGTLLQLLTVILVIRNISV